MIVKVILILCVLCGSAHSQAKSKERVLTPQSSLPSVILGIWWSSDQPQSAAFQIKDSSIYYPDTFTEYPYTVQGDSIFVHRDDGITVSVVLKVTKDTLILRSFDITQVYTRAEPQRQ